MRGIVRLKSVVDDNNGVVEFECTRCGESFTRHYSQCMLMHACPVYRTINTVRHKWCSGCEKYQPLTDFTDDIQPTCQTTEPAPSAMFMEWLKVYHARLKNDCELVTMPFMVTIEDLAKLWYEQQGQCCYTGMAMDFGAQTTGAILRTINSTKGYVPGNVVWTVSIANSIDQMVTTPKLIKFIKDYIYGPVRCEFKKLDPRGRMPQRKKPTDAGWDLYALEDVTLPRGSTVTTVKTGIALVVPPGYYYTIEGRSGFWRHGIVPCRGIMDATYSGEILVAMHNHSGKDYSFAAGERFAQLTIHREVPIDIVEVESIDESYNLRGAAGHGSTGKT